MTERWTEIAKSDNYPGLTRLHDNGRTWVCIGTGAHVGEALASAAALKHNQQRG